MFIQKIADITGNADRTKEGKEQRVGNGQGRVASGKEGSNGSKERGPEKRRGQTGVRRSLSLPFTANSVGWCKERGNVEQMGMRIVRRAREGGARIETRGL